LKLNAVGGGSGGGKEREREREKADLISNLDTAGLTSVMMGGVNLVAASSKLFQQGKKAQRGQKKKGMTSER